MSMHNVPTYTPEPRFSDTLEFQPFHTPLHTPDLRGYDDLYMAPFDLSDTLTTEAQSEQEIAEWIAANLILEGN